MPRPSALQQFLDRLPHDQMEEATWLARTAPTGKQAYKELKKLGYKASYDAVVNWRVLNTNNRSISGRVQDPESKLNTAADGLSPHLKPDPIEQTMHLSRRLNTLCNSLVDLLERHDWTEGEHRLSNREASKILSAIPALSRASVGGVLEMHQIRAKIDEKLFAAAIIYELGQDWRKTLQHDNPELMDLFDIVAEVTKARLEIDRPSLLEEHLGQQQE